MRRLGLCIGALLLCALLLFGCGNSTSSQTPTSVGRATPPAETKRLYSLRMGNAWDGQAVYTILDEGGQVVLQGQHLSLLYDHATGMPQCILAERYERESNKSLWGDSEGYKTYSALYDTEGNLLEDWQQVSYSSGLGPYVLRMVRRRDLFGEKSWSGCMYNIYTKDSHYDGVRYLNDMSDGVWGVIDGTGTMLGVLDAEANAVMGFPMRERWFGPAYAWNGGYITSLQKETARIDVVVDKDFTVLYTAEAGFSLRTMGNWLIEWNWEIGEKRILDSNFEEVYSVGDYWDIRYYNGDIMVLYNFSIELGTVLCDGVGNELLRDCGWIVPGCKDGSYDAERIIVYKDGALYVLDAKGSVLIQKEGKYYGCEYVGSGRYVLYGPDNGNGAHGREYVLVDEDMEPLSDTYGYLYTCSEPYCIEEANFYIAGRGDTSHGGTKTDVLDMDGNIVLADVTEVQECGPDRFVVVWGFSCGLVDGQGNWLYKTSAFGVLEDE